MKKSLIILIMMATCFQAFSQFFESAIRFELRYPVPIGDNFINKNALIEKGYTGLLDAGIEYNIYKAGPFGAGISFNTSVLRLKDIEVTATGFLPKVHAEYEIRNGSFSFIPQVAFGYSHWRFKGPDTDFIDDNGNPVHIANKITENGFSAEGSLRILQRTGSPVSWFIELSYSYTRLEKPEQVQLDTDYNRNISIIYPGLGLAWRF